MTRPCLAIYLLLFASLVSCTTAPRRDLTTVEYGMLEASTGLSLPTLFGGGKVDLSDLREMAKTPFDFHGIVQTPDGTPIPDAEVSYVLFDRPLFPPRFPYFAGHVGSRIQSDAEGRFRLQSKAAFLLMEAVKPGYVSHDAVTASFYFAPSLQERNEQSLPTRNEPATFLLIPESERGELGDISTGGITIPAETPAWGVRLAEPNPQGVPPEHAEVLVKIEDGTCKVSVPNGALRETIDVLSHRVEPEPMGPTVALTLEEDLAGHSRARAYLDLRLAGGGYARVEIRAHQRRDGRRFFSLVGRLNRSGSQLY